MTKRLPDKFDVAFSFAGEDRDYVSKVRKALEQSGLTIFYDEDYETALWGATLTEVLPDVYSRRARAVVMFISSDYARKDWTVLEKRAALDKALTERDRFIFPARFDDTELPGLSTSIGYIDLRKLTPEEFAAKIIKTIGPGEQKSGPPNSTSTTVSAVQRIEQREALRRYQTSGEGMQLGNTLGHAFLQEFQQRMLKLKSQYPVLGIQSAQIAYNLVANQAGLEGASIEIVYDQQYINRIDDAELSVTLWEGFKGLPGRAYIQAPWANDPVVHSEEIFKPVCQQIGEWKWLDPDGKTTYTNSQLSDHLESQFLELIDHRHAGNQ